MTHFLSSFGVVFLAFGIRYHLVLWSDGYFYGYCFLPLMKLEGVVKDFMSRDFPTTGIHESVCMLIGKMRDGYLVVIDGKDIVGMLTEMDILRSIRKSPDPGKLSVAECMTPCKLTGSTTCYQISEDRPADEALEVMTTADVSHVLVYDKAKRVVGVVSVGSLLRSIKACKLLEP